MAKRKSDTAEAAAISTIKKQRESVPTFTSAAEIKALEATILKSSKNYNSLARLLDTLKKSVKSDTADVSEEIQVELITALFRIFGKLLKKGELRSSKSFTAAQTEVVLWLAKRYDAFKHTLYDVIRTSEEDTLQVLALQIALRLFKLENQYYVPNETFFPRDILAGVVEAVYWARDNADPVVDEFMDNYVAVYDDLRYHFLNVLGDMLTESDALRTNDAAARAADRLFAHLITIGDNFPEADDQLTEFFLIKPKAPKNVQVSSPLMVSSHKVKFQKALLAAFRLPIEAEQYRAILTVLHKAIVPNMAQPQFLMDFLSDAYEAGGPIALLALNSLFYLIQNHNLDYPKFFQKLYTLLDASILHVKYRSRFFRLLDLFLTSTHISVAVVASFIKRISRLALFAPPSAIVAIVPFVYNQLKRHPTCMVLIHRPEVDGDEDPETRGFKDPFDNEQTDPALTNAIASSLWELETLQSHYHPNVATLARIMSEQFRKPQYVLEDFLDMSYSSLMAAEQGRRLKRAPALEFERFETVFEEPARTVEEDEIAHAAFMNGWMY
ncbi:hypothetical protein DV113_000161 [Geotrichum candidum]|uniref:Similar to Saccharomyces cerevisiae YPR144C NOC4 Nucleolar protein, forms a complex with Nop14p that mediates maturation and nuclear export of 40S ribosomal subunits n=1 Tax=Geotrichum candidum TaxID=1173061 RepID=A0A0J9X7K3_GEOCN|nr:hypothetical protein DV113_000161 [Geotrichum candidum]KAI8132958.1 hypothetical protein DUD61_003405 [Geotrichum candidum]KAI9213084.1 hypothetical protein DS838_002024 [Geotrichum bryndzae]CDO53440.1 similar to Saccharomyces cerevisiae YPR144C NOC4 Nucleolar protein, forms a complex with Nop14p that mediates maturation and nuclear export of 40S ribosomal subunits [Geotrichum candidum]